MRIDKGFLRDENERVGPTIDNLYINVALSPRLADFASP
jgi:hypothetical protein